MNMPKCGVIKNPKEPTTSGELRDMYVCYCGTTACEEPIKAYLSQGFNIVEGLNIITRGVIIHKP